MKGILISLIGLVCFQGSAVAQVDVGINISNGRLRDFYLAIGDYYHVPPQRVVEVRERYRLPEEELPVVYFLAARAHVEPAAIISLRIRKMSWFDIAFHYHLTPEIFFVPVESEHVGPPYGNAYGYYRKHRQTGDWRKGRLSDREIEDLVGLRFMSEYYRKPPEEVIRLRDREPQFVVINNGFWKEKHGGKPEKADRKSKGKSKGKPKGKGKGKN